MNKKCLKKNPVIFFIVLLFSAVLLISCPDNVCWVCVGNGKCYECNGKGYTKVDSNACAVCKGTGICFNCQGTGRIDKR